MQLRPTDHTLLEALPRSAHEPGPRCARRPWRAARPPYRSALQQPIPGAAAQAHALKNSHLMRGLLQAAGRRDGLHARRGIYPDCACVARSHSMLCIMTLGLEQFCLKHAHAAAVSARTCSQPEHSSSLGAGSRSAEAAAGRWTGDIIYAGTTRSTLRNVLLNYKYT